MPIYILHDHVMNGTVTMQTEITGIESDNFAAAVSKARRWLDSLGAKLINISVTDNDLTAEIDIGEPGIREFIGMNDMPPGNSEVGQLAKWQGTSLQMRISCGSIPTLASNKGLNGYR